ncbi:hypothetical protein JXA70_10990, partial [candidate division KSB1 bacterium]|nr:hypothetical protein [candidate division KSB1 bacterium]
YFQVFHIDSASPIKTIFVALCLRVNELFRLQWRRLIVFPANVHKRFERDDGLGNLLSDIQVSGY